MDKSVTIVNKKDQEKLDKKFWLSASIEERFNAFKIIMQNYISLTYGSDPGFQRVITIIKRK